MVWSPKNALAGAGSAATLSKHVSPASITKKLTQREARTAKLIILTAARAPMVAGLCLVIQALACALTQGAAEIPLKSGAIAESAPNSSSMGNANSHANEGQSEYYFLSHV